MSDPQRREQDYSGAAPFPFSRESKIRFDAEGRFFHEGQLVEHQGLCRAMGSWMNRHPHDGRWVLDNGYDWCWLLVDDAPFVVVRCEVVGDELRLTLNDESVETVRAEAIWVDEEGAIRCLVHADKRGGAMPARFGRHAAAALGERLVELEDGGVGLQLASGTRRLRGSPSR